MSLTFARQNLCALNTLALTACAPVATLEDESDLPELCEIARGVDRVGAGVFVLGAGSNVLVQANPARRVVRVALRGVNLWDETADDWIVEAAAGENWHDFVRSCVLQGWSGLENLALIPGTVGAAPVQNIGAYGLELAQRLHSLVAWNLRTAHRQEFSPAACGFAYRDSHFKRAGPGRWLITRVRFALPKRWAPHLDYPDLRAYFGLSPKLPSRHSTNGRQAADGYAEPSAREVFEAVCAIRRRKLPDPAVLPNAGSFFKNPVVSQSVARALKRRYADLRAYRQADGVKLAAGWLIERAGWKGRRLGPVGMHAHQALVLVNYGGASARDVLALQEAVQFDVRERFGVRLEREPVLLD